MREAWHADKSYRKQQQQSKSAYKERNKNNIGLQQKQKRLVDYKYREKYLERTRINTIKRLVLDDEYK